MAEQAIVHIGENSPHQVAYKLMVDILRAGGKGLYASDNPDAATEAEIIRAYQIGLNLVYGHKVN